MKSNHLLMLWTLFVSLVLCQPAYALLINGDFTSGLDDWVTSGSVSAVSEAAQLDDSNGNYYSMLTQAGIFSPGTHTFSFDYQVINLGAAPVDEPFSTNDLFSATLFGTNSDPVDFSQYVSLAQLQLQDSLMPTQHKFSITFQNEYSHLIPYFELLDGNFIESDSCIVIDNVIITEEPQTAPIPEPATFILLLAGMFSIIGLKRFSMK